MYLFGYFFSWIVVSWIFIGIALIQCIGLCFVPESPSWLMSQNNIDGATKSLQFLRGKDNDFSKEIECLKLATNQTQDKSIQIWKEFLKPEAYKPLSIIIILIILQHFGGSFAVVFYAVDIFQGIGHDTKMDTMKENSYLSAIAVGSIRIIGSILGKTSFLAPFYARAEHSSFVFCILSFVSIHSYQNKLEDQEALLRDLNVA